MSFLKKSLRALGFSDDEEQEYIYTAKDITDGTVDRHVTAVETKEPEQPKDAESKSADEFLPDALLEKVVELVNSSLPDFVRNCIDHESEKRYIYEQLGDSFKNYVTELSTNARRQSEQEVAQARQKLEQDMNALKQKTTELEEQKNEIKNAQLSAERQKRALNEKVHDLDTRIATLEAEKEQYELENKSLVNKLKVSGVKQQELDDALSENTRLLGIIQELKTGTAQTSSEELSAKEDEIAQLQQVHNTLQAEKESLQVELQAAHDKAKADMERIAEMAEEIDQLQKAVQLLEKVEAKVEKYELLEADKKRIEEENSTLRTRVEALQTEMEELRKQPVAAPVAATTDDGEELQKANVMIDALKKQRQELISQTATLRSQNKTYENQISALESKLDDLQEKIAKKNAKSIDFSSNEETVVVEDNVEDCINWMMPVLPDSLEEEARRREEEEKRLREEEKALQAEREHRAAREDASQMSLW